MTFSPFQPFRPLQPFRVPLGGGAVIPPEFILQMQTTGASESITLPMTGTVAVDIDWGDGSAIETFSTASPSHVYATAGTYDIKITGSCGVFGFNNGGDKDKLLNVLNGGTEFVAGSWANGFYGCTNMLTANFAGLDTSSVTDMSRMFQTCSSLTSLDVSNFDTSNVITMFVMFQDCSSLTSLDVSGFNTPLLQTTGFMFQNCSSLTSLDVSGFNTSNVVGMGNMFRNCSSLTSLDVSNFDTSNVTTMGDMFRDCSGLTSDPGIHAFNVTSLTSGTRMCQNANAMLSETEYNTILTNWEAQAVLNNVPAHFGDAQYSGAGATARAALVLPVLDGGKGWTITDGGAAP